MSEEDRRLLTETIAEMRELKGELHAFKEHVIDRIRRIEDGTDRRRRDRLTTAGIVISAGLLALNLVFGLMKL
jgi:hypothetical protein